MNATEMSSVLSSCTDILPFLLSGLLLFKHHNKSSGILFFVYSASFLFTCYSIYYTISGKAFIYEIRIIYDLIEHIIFIWFCASLIAFSNWKGITCLLCTAIFAGWMHMALFMSRDQIMNTLGTYEMIEMISYVPFAGFAMMRQVELSYKKDNSGEQILLFAIILYAFSTVVILGLFNTAIGKDHYYIHNISAIIKDLLLSYGFWMIIKRERKKNSPTEFSTKPTEF